jgi:starch phosphorylase
MWRALWPDRPWQQAPVGHITNGVHVPTWIAPEMARLFASYLAEDWLSRLSHPDLWDRILHLDPAPLWEVKRVLKGQLRAFTEKRLRSRHERLGTPGPVPALDPEALTIGVARRFAEYKRAALLFTDPDRLARILAAPGRPVQVLFAGKAHPRDDIGKSILRALDGHARDPRFAGRIFLLENHDLNMARHLVQGCDLWLNLPRRPLEACGTSGMKAVFNGTLNLSTLDGWWAEAYDGVVGFAFGDGLTHPDPAFQDRRDAADLYAVLENQVIPEFYDRDDGGIPRRWVARVQAALARLAWRYNSDRMVIDYVTHAYLPAAGLATSESRPSP